MSARSDLLGVIPWRVAKLEGKPIFFFFTQVLFITPGFFPKQNLYLTLSIPKLEEVIRSCLRRAVLGGGSWWVALLIDDFISCRESVLGSKNIHKMEEGRRKLSLFSFLPSASHRHLVLVPKYAF